MHHLIPVAVVEEFNQAFNKAKTFKKPDGILHICPVYFYIYQVLFFYVMHSILASLK